MVGFLSKIKENKALTESQQKIFKDKELVLDVLAESMQGQKICPLMSVIKSQKCIGKFCEFFHEYNTVGGLKYSRCSFNQAPALQIELLQEMRRLNNALLGIVKETAEEIKKK